MFDLSGRPVDTPTGPPSKSRRSIRGEDVRFLFPALQIPVTM